RYVTLEVHDHPRGRGRQRADTHELVELRLGGRWIALDPMANRVLGAPVEELLAHPELADRAAASRLPDERVRGGGYHLYCASFFYERVVRFCRRESLTSGEPWHWIPHRKAAVGSSRARGTTRRILLLDHRESESPAAGAGSDSPPVRSWTRADLLS